MLVLSRYQVICLGSVDWNLVLFIQTWGHLTHNFHSSLLHVAYSLRHFKDVIGMPYPHFLVLKVFQLAVNVELSKATILRLQSLKACCICPCFSLCRDFVGCLWNHKSRLGHLNHFNLRVGAYDCLTYFIKPLGKSEYSFHLCCMFLN